MNGVEEIVIHALLIGIGATAVMDIAAKVANLVVGMPMSNWALVGRWVGHFPQGRFRHENIAKAMPVSGELAIGWIVHYATGIVYAALVLAIGGLEWARNPTLGLALAVGVSMLVAPFFVMQPGMGYGIAASRTPKPGQARVRSLLNHVVFGCGIYVAASVLVGLF